MPRSSQPLPATRAKYSSLALAGLALVVLATGASAINGYYRLRPQAQQNAAQNTTAMPTATPMPTVSPVPTATPMPTVTPLPTATPTPTASPTPDPSPSPTPSPSPRPPKTLLPGVTVTLTPRGFEPQELTIAAARFFLLIENRSGRRGLTLLIDPEQGNRVLEFTQPEDALDWIDELNLPPGRYTLTTRERPDWVCQLTVTVQ